MSSAIITFTAETFTEELKNEVLNQLKTHNDSQNAFMVDCHAHLISEEFQNKLTEIVTRSSQSLVQKIIVVPQDLKECHEVLHQSTQFPDIFLPSAGLHPCRFQFSSNRSNDLTDILQFIDENHQKLVCVGEIGLDYSPWLLKEPEQDKAEQLSAFKQFIASAKKYDLTLNVHSRNASPHVVNALIDSEVPPARVLLHAFDGSVKVRCQTAYRCCCFVLRCSRRNIFNNLFFTVWWFVRLLVVLFLLVICFLFLAQLFVIHIFRMLLNQFR